MAWVQARGRAESHRRDTVTSIRGVVAVALLFGTGLVVALPGVGLEPAAMAQPREERFFRVEWSAGAVRPDQSRIVGYVYNDYGEDAVNVQLISDQPDR